MMSDQDGEQRRVDLEGLRQGVDSANLEITRILMDWGGGDEKALVRIAPLVYDELRKRARQLFYYERANHTLTPTALANEGYLRMIDARQTRWESRSHFLRVASRAMRRVLIDYARKRLAKKRSAQARTDYCEEVLAAERSPSIIALCDALEDLRKMDTRQCRIVELRFYGGLTIEEVAAALDCSPSTVSREWRSARIWLRLQLKRDSKSELK